MVLFAKHTDAQYRALEKELAKTQTQLAQIQSERTEQLDAKEAQLAAIQEERSSLLAQLLQVQQERDSVLTKLQESETRVADLQGKLKSESDAKTAETQRRAALESQLADLQAKLKSESDAKTAETQRRAALESQLADLQAKLKSESDAKTAEVAKSKDLQEENDLLLAQLHQVQEELEKYYLNNKDLEAGVAEATTTLKLARQALVNTLIDTRGYALPPVAPPAPTGAKVVRLPARISPPKALPKTPQRTSARKSSKSK